MHNAGRSILYHLVDYEDEAAVWGSAALDLERALNKVHWVHLCSIRACLQGRMGPDRCS